MSRGPPSLGVTEDALQIARTQNTAAYDAALSAAAVTFLATMITPDE